MNKMRSAAAVFVVSVLAVEAHAFPAFQEVVINDQAEVVYAVEIVDMNRDGKPDIVGLSATFVAWYENPTWTMHKICGQLRNDNVCVAAHDVDGDRIPELAVGADWQFNNTNGGGALYLLMHEGDPKQPWRSIILREPVPTLHRIRWADVDGDGKKELLVAPLKGVGSHPPDFADRPARLFLLRPPSSFKDNPWPEELIDESLHVCHNIWPWRRAGRNQDDLLTASYEGIHLFRRSAGGAWTKDSIARGNYEPAPRAGAGEVKVTTSPPWMIAGIEPWHANQVAVYTAGESADSEWNRNVIDDTYAGGHLVYWADFDGDGDQDLLAGHREKAPATNAPGLYVYENVDRGATWNRHAIDVVGMATEDGAAADLNGDGRVDIVAGGRATHNIKVYLNTGRN